MESWVVSLQLISFCLFRIGLIVQDHSDPLFSSYAYKSHYLLNESNRAELMKLPMIPPSSSASKKKCEKGNQNSFFLFIFLSLFLLFFSVLFGFFKLNQALYALIQHLLVALGELHSSLIVSVHSCWQNTTKGLKIINLAKFHSRSEWALYQPVS